MKPEAEKSSEDLDEAGTARRNFLDNAGKLAAFTPPLMLGLLMPSEHAIASGGGPINTPRPQQGGGDDDSGGNDDDGGD